MGKKKLVLPFSRLIKALYFLVFFSIVESADRIARELDASAKRETVQKQRGFEQFTIQSRKTLISLILKVHADIRIFCPLIKYLHKSLTIVQKVKGEELIFTVTVQWRQHAVLCFPFCKFSPRISSRAFTIMAPTLQFHCHSESPYFGSPVNVTFEVFRVETRS